MITTDASRGSADGRWPGVLVAVAVMLAGCGGGAASPPVGPLTAAPTTSTLPPFDTPTTEPAVTPSPSPSPAPTPAPTPPPTLAAKGPRPANGAVIVRQGRAGEGVLSIDNGTSDDAYVTLARDGRAARAVYVRGGQKARLTGIADGDYQLFYASGSGWNVDAHTFTVNADYNRFDDSFPYTTTARASTIWEVTLEAVVNGNASTSSVSPEAIPQ